MTNTIKRIKPRKFKYSPPDMPQYYPDYYIINKNEPGEGYKPVKFGEFKNIKAYLKGCGFFTNGILKIYFDPDVYPSYDLICQILSNTSYKGLPYSILYLERLKTVGDMSTSNWRRNLALFCD